jgi:hypothetical protein
MYEGVIGHGASRTRRMIAALGETKALSRLVRSAELQRGFRVLRDHGQLDQTFEAVVLRFPEQFHSEVIAAARWRLDHPYDLANIT